MSAGDLAAGDLPHDVGDGTHLSTRDRKEGGQYE
jgi:hypothetical protein